MKFAPKNRTRTAGAVLTGIVVCASLSVADQGDIAYAADDDQVDQIWTDFDGFWTSGNGSGSYAGESSVKPNDHHDLLAFAWNGTTYSTGVNDALLTSNSVSFTAANWEALPIESVPYTVNSGSSTCSTWSVQDYFGPALGSAATITDPMGACYSGEELASYLTAGTNGLDLGSAVINLKPDNSLITFPVLSVDPSAINDGVPDVLVNSVAQPSATADTFSFREADGSTLVGSTLSQTLADADSVGRWTMDLYNKDGSGPYLEGVDRDYRLLAFDFSDFGITTSNYSSIRQFNWSIDDETDTAFVAVNSGSVTVSATTEDCLDSGNTIQGTKTTQIAADNGDVIITFTVDEGQTGACTWTVPTGVFATHYLAVGGGGGGGSGGGGAGEVVTSWSYTVPGSSQVSAIAPLSVSPGAELAIQVGSGGNGGGGGSPRCDPDAANTCTGWDIASANGTNSSFGSVSAAGGGAGGQSVITFNSDGSVATRVGAAGAAGGSSGGAGFDFDGIESASASPTNIPGAVSLVNSGGAFVGSGGFRAGGGGGGAGSVGSNPNVLYLGGDGGRGIFSTIGGMSVEYGCGGGGGVNSNSEANVTDGGGAGGCGSAGNGASWGQLLNTDSVSSGLATPALDDFGGGGGGADPEGARTSTSVQGTGGSDGGNGVVIIRYSPANLACPYSASASPSLPVACPASVTIVAGGSAASTSVGATPISYADGTTSITSVVSPDSDISVSNTSSSVTITVSNANTDLVGGTYPIVYTLTRGGVTSTSYILLTISDPNQLTPVNLVAEPRTTEVTLPRFVLGGSGVGASDEVMICLTPNSANPDTSVSLSNQAGVSVESRGTNSRGISIRGPKSTLESRTGEVRVSHSTADSRLFTEASSVVFDVSVSVTQNGGNNQCSVGTPSTVTITEASLVSDQRFEIAF